ncbi:MAG: HD domain-containing protein [Candidatus Moranbacteria bacterium]|nr:HD domain-containing protein [Candidatus Moranbacteria bacterium]
MKINVPVNIIKISKELEEKGFESFLVGGCVRDLLSKKTPKDWDVATSAKPEQILEVFPFGKYENEFGTVVLPEKYLAKPAVASSDFSIKEEDKNKLVKSADKYIEKIHCPIHSSQHAENVIKNALEIAREYKEVNLDLVEIIAFYHDLGFLKYKDKNHIQESANIFQEEAEKVGLKKKMINMLKELIDHDTGHKSKYLEQQILKEADILDGLSILRCKKAHKIEMKDYFDWIKNKYNYNWYYGFFVTEKGKQMLEKAVIEFNKDNFGFKLPEFEKRNNVYEVTTFRKEGKYTDKRRPDEVVFAEKVEDDLKRRDFTINAMAVRFLDVEKLWKRAADSSFDVSMEVDEYEIKDFYGGKIDLESKLIRTVGDPYERIEEDVLRMMRAVRFAVQLDFDLAVSTLEAIRKKADNLKYISKERIKDELVKIIISNNPAKGVDLLVECGLMRHIVPEVEKAVGVRQNRHHYYGPYNTVYKHMLASLEKCPSEKLEVRLAAFLHDIGKPQTKRGQGINSTFHGHEYLGAKLTRRVLERLKFPRETIEKTVMLVKNHMFYYNVDEVGESGVRRVVQKVGLENINDLIDVRIADRLGSGVPKAVPYKLRHFKYMVERVSQDPVSVKQLEIDGNDLIQELEINPGPKIGAILELLLAEVIDNPQLNNREYLLEEAGKLSKKEVEALRKQARDKIKKEEKKEDKKIKEKYHVK